MSAGTVSTDQMELKMAKKIFALALSLAAFVLPAMPANAAEIIINEDFTNNFGVFTANGNVIRENGLGGVYGPCCGTNPAVPNFFVGFGPFNRPSGSISFGFDTDLGKLYTLIFKYSVIGSGSGTLTASVDGNTFNVSQNGVTGNAALNFTTATFNFLGTGNNTSLVFSSPSSANNRDPLLDFVSLSAVPEPGTWMLMLLGFGAIGFSMRSRKKDQARIQFA